MLILENFNTDREIKMQDWSEYMESEIQELQNKLAQIDLISNI